MCIHYFELGDIAPTAAQGPLDRLWGGIDFASIVYPVAWNSGTGENGQAAYDAVYQTAAEVEQTTGTEEAPAAQAETLAAQDGVREGNYAAWSKQRAFPAYASTERTG